MKESTRVIESVFDIDSTENIEEQAWKEYCKKRGWVTWGIGDDRVITLAKKDQTKGIGGKNNAPITLDATAISLLKDYSAAKGIKIFDFNKLILLVKGEEDFGDITVTIGDWCEIKGNGTIKHLKIRNIDNTSTTQCLKIEGKMVFIKCNLEFGQTYCDVIPEMRGCKVILRRVEVINDKLARRLVELYNAAELTDKEERELFNTYRKITVGYSFTVLGKNLQGVSMSEVKNSPTYAKNGQRWEYNHSKAKLVKDSNGDRLWVYWCYRPELK